ncbi:unnamed protein product, partial [Brassica oleracea var. botrytis]
LKKRFLSKYEPLPPLSSKVTVSPSNFSGGRCLHRAAARPCLISRFVHNCSGSFAWCRFCLLWRSCAFTDPYSLRFAMGCRLEAVGTVVFRV